MEKIFFYSILLFSGDVDDTSLISAEDGVKSVAEHVEEDANVADPAKVETSALSVVNEPMKRYDPSNVDHEKYEVKVPGKSTKKDVGEESSVLSEPEVKKSKPKKAKTDVVTKPDASKKKITKQEKRAQSEEQRAKSLEMRTNERVEKKSAVAKALKDVDNKSASSRYDFLLLFRKDHN